MSARVNRVARNGVAESSFRFNPLEHVRNIYVRFAQGVFAAAPRGTMHWEADLEDTEIVITGESPIHVSALGHRPGVTVTRGPVLFQSLGFDDMIKFNFNTGAKMKSVLIPGTMTLNCCSRSDIESERIAMILAESLWGHRDQLMKLGFYDIGRGLRISSPSPPGAIISGDTGDEFYMTSVLSPFHFQRTMQVTPLGRPVLEDAGLALDLSERPVSSAGPAESTSGSMPYQIDNTYENATCEDLPKVPHPLDPTQRVTVRSVTPYSPAVRAPSIGGRLLLSRPCVEDSVGQMVTKTVVKI